MCPLVNGWITKQWCIHSVENYSTLKREEIETQVTIWVEESIVMSEISQVQKHTYHTYRMTLLACGTYDVRLRERELMEHYGSRKWDLPWNAAGQYQLKIYTSMCLLQPRFHSLVMA